MNTTRSHGKHWSTFKLVGSILIAFFGLLNATAFADAAGPIAPEWKAHFKANLTVENCIFERTTFSFGTNFGIYQVRFQKDAFVMREISTSADADSDHIVGGRMYAGRLGSNYWAIEGGQVLKLFPNADKMITDMSNPEASLIDGPRSTLISALYYGFPSLNPATIEWLDDATFAASHIRGARLRGKILDTAGGMPTAIEWHWESAPNVKFLTEFKYLRKLDLPYYPSEISLRQEFNGRTAPVAIFRLLSLKTAQAPLPATWFDSARYYWATNFSPTNSSPARILKVEGNDLYFTNGNGAYAKVLRQTPDDGTSSERVDPRVRSLFALGFAAFSAVGLYLTWKLAKQQKQ